MAEISYPFSADNLTTGAAKVVSETQWQAMAHMWGGDRVDFQLTEASYSSATLPFMAKVVNVSTVSIDPGKGWVGGFYYSLTTTMNVTIDANSTSQNRIDLIVIRADMSKPAVNLAVRKGIPANTATSPQPVRQEGGLWELPLWEVTVPANGGTIGVSSRAPFNMPPAVAYPWNTGPSAALLPMGTFSYDMDSNGASIQNEYFNSLDGIAIARTMGKSYTYTPLMYYDANIPYSKLTRNGRWRWIAPNTVHFSVNLTQKDTGAWSSDDNIAYGIQLPVPASRMLHQVFHGTLTNPTGEFYPTFTSLTGRVSSTSSSIMSVYIPSSTSVSGGLDNFNIFPTASSISFSGVYEANEFNEG